MGLEACEEEYLERSKCACCSRPLDATNRWRTCFVWWWNQLGEKLKEYITVKEYVCTECFVATKRARGFRMR
jgi:hypothetical protein